MNDPESPAGGSDGGDVPREPALGPGEAPREPRPMIERIGLAAIALVLAVLFGGVSAASWVGGGSRPRANDQRPRRAMSSLTAVLRSATNASNACCDRQIRPKKGPKALPPAGSPCVDGLP